MGFLDSIINYVSPGWGVKRELARMQIKAVGNVSGSFGGMSGMRGGTAIRLENQWLSKRPSQYIAGTSHTNWQLDNIRERARSLELNNPIANAMISRAVENLVGDGFGLQPMTDDPTFNTKVEEMFWEWADSADISGRSFLRLQKLWMRSHIRDGDVGISLLDDGTMQSFEGDRIRNPYKVNKDSIIVDGVELDEVDRPLAYWIETLVNNKVDYLSVKAENFILFMQEHRLCQSRGISYLQSAFSLFDHIDDWIKASVIAAKIAACYGIVIKSTNPAQAMRNLSTSTNGGGEEQRIQSIEPGMIQYLKPDEDISTLTPSQPQQAFDATIRALVRMLGLPLGMPIELLMLDFSQTSYSSARASALQAHRSFEAIQAQFNEQVLSRIYKWRVQKWIDEGKLEKKPDALKHKWHAQPWPYLNPIQEIQAEMVAVDAGFKTMHDVHAALGTDFDTFVRVRSGEIKSLRDAGIPLMRGTLSAPIAETTPEDLQAKLDAMKQAEGTLNEDQ